MGIKERMETIKFGPFLGINNRLPDFALKVEAGQYLRTADNVDIDNAGKIRRRRGVTRAQAMSNAHSVRITSSTGGFLVRASVLYAITLPAYSETLLKVLASDADMIYVKLGADWYFSNGTDAGRVTAGVAYPMGLPTPVAPALSTVGGSLLKGNYLVAVAYVNVTTSEEGGISPTTLHNLEGSGGVRVTLPGAVTGATHANVYLSDSNGTVPQLHSTVALGSATVDLTTLATGRPSTMRFEAPLPAGTLFNANGRICSHAGSMVYVGLPFRPGYYLPAEGYIPFPSTVSIAVTNQGGTYVAADKTYFVPGDLGNVQGNIADVLPYGAVPGTVFESPDEALVGWFGEKGFVLANASGGVETPMAKTVNVTLPATGSASVCECEGYTRVSSCGYTMNLQTKAVTTYSGNVFTSMSRCYATKVDGIYITDADTPVNASVGFGKQDLGSEERKGLPAIYLGTDSPSPMNMQVKTPSMDYTYAARSAGADMQVQRIDPGLGLIANYFDLTLTNTSGADFALAFVSLGPSVTTRRI